MGLLSGIAGVIGGLGSLFKKNKTPTPAQNLLSQAQGAREAAAQYGFNPLTMLQYGQPGGSLASGGAPPLASVEFLADAIGGLEREFNGDAERERQADQLNLDLARLKIEQARSGVVLAPQSAAQAIGGIPSPLGARHVTVMPSGSVTRKVDNAPIVGNSPRPNARQGSVGRDGTIPLEIPYDLGNGHTTMGPNPQGADIEQMAMTVALKAKSLAERYWTWWQKEAPPKYRSAHDTLFGKRNNYVSQMAYGPQLPKIPKR